MQGVATVVHLRKASLVELFQSEAVPKSHCMLQGATTVDEVEARMRWETANADGKNAAFDPAVPAPKFKAPDKAAAVARALPIVLAAYR